MTGRELGDQPAFPGFQYTDGHGPMRQVPVPDGCDPRWETYAPGITTRAWLAGQVIQGMLGNPSLLDTFSASVTVAREAVLQTDALLDELAKERPAP